MSPEVRSGRADLGPIASRAEAPASLEIPSPHLGLDWRPLKLADAHTLHGLVAAIEHADGLVSRAALGDVEEWLRRPWHHLSSDSLAGFDHLGELRAYGLVAIEPGESSRVRALLDGGVHPEWRGVGVGRALVAWMEGRGRQLLAGTGAEGPASLAVYVDASVRDRRAMYAAAGFSPVRWFTELRRSLTEPIPELPAPDGVRVLPWCEELDEAVRRTHSRVEAERGGPAHGRHPSASDIPGWHGPYAAPQWSLVALDHADGVAGYLLSQRFGTPAQGSGRGHVLALGVVAEHRRSGLAGALAAGALHRYRADGMQHASIDVDADPQVGALELDDRLGFEPAYASVLYTVEI